MTTLGINAFAENNISNLTLGNGLQTIGDSAFMKNNILRVTLPDSLTSVGKMAFFKNANDPVIGIVSWDPADPANEAKKQALEGVVVLGTKTHLQLQQAHNTARKMGIKFDLDGGQAPTGNPTIFNDRETTAEYENGEMIPKTEFAFFKDVKPTKAGYMFTGWNYKLHKADGTVILDGGTDYWDFGFNSEQKPELSYMMFTADWEVVNLIRVEKISGTEVEVEYGTPEADAKTALPQQGQITDSA